MTKKSFFKERTARDIGKLRSRMAHTSRGLVSKIQNLGESDSVRIMTRLIPGRFCRNTQSSQEASRKCYKHGDYLVLDQPTTQGEAYACSEIPLAIRANDFAKLEDIPEEEINVLGYSFRPVQGRDRRKRKVPLVWVLEGTRLFAYAESMTGGIDVKPYDESKRVSREGADVVCRVPSRTKGKSRYNIKLKSVPVEGVTERRAVAWSLRSEYADGNASEHSQFNIRYTYDGDREGSDVFTFYPQDIAAYIGVIKHYVGTHNLVPIEMSPIALPSKQLAEFYTKLNNNVLIYDSSLSSKDKLRKLHIAEKSILIARNIGHYGHDNTLFWDPARDGKFRDYDWGQKDK